MTPVPKNLSRLGALRWRRAVARGASPTRGAVVAAAGAPPAYRAEAGSVSATHGFTDFPSDAHSLDRNTRGAE